MAKKNESTAVAYVILGIVAIMAIVGLVLLFRSGMSTGKYSVALGQNIEGVSGCYENREGGLSCPEWYAQEKAKLARQGYEAQTYAS